MGEWSFEIDYLTLAVCVSAIGALVLQLFLCFKVRGLFIKLLPIFLLILATVAFSICSAVINGWDGLGYLFLAIFSFGLLIVCGIGWGIWAIIRKSRNRH